MDDLKIALNPMHWLSWWKIWRGLPVFNWIIGAYWFKQKNFKRAAELYRRGIQKHPHHKALRCARMDYAYCLYALGDWLAAKDELYGIVASGTRLKEAYLLLAEIELLVGRTDVAVKVLKRCLQCFPDDARTLTALAFTACEAEAPPSKLRELRFRLERIKSELDMNNPILSKIDAVIAQQELYFGDAVLGERMLARVLASDGSPSEALILRGEQFFRQGRILQGRKILAHAIRAVPRHPKAYALLATSYLIVQDEKKADWALHFAIQAVQKSFWQNSRYLKLLADAYVAVGDVSAAILIEERIKALQAGKGLDLEAFKSIQVQFQRLATLTSS